MRVEVKVSCAVARSPRVMQVEGMFDVAPSERREQSWQVEMPIEERPWNVGLIVGPSGSGKSTVARRLFGDALVDRFDWAPDAAVVDGFPERLGIKDVVGLLSAVGFSSPPSWLQPFGTLSTGQQFRVHMARVLAEQMPLACVDEFTSTVDRTVAQVGSSALEKAVRRRGQKFVAVTCHEDVEGWLNPDWVYRPAERVFGWRGLQRRPPIELEVRRVESGAWDLFKAHHYLTASLHRSAVCFGAFWRDRLVCFDAWLPFVGRLRDRVRAMRGHRTVCLPDYQGVGIGNALFTFGASLWAGQGYRALSCTGHPAEVASRMRSPVWRLSRSASHSTRDSRLTTRARAVGRLTVSFEYVGPELPREEGLRILGRDPS